MDRLIPDPAGTGATLADIVIEAISEQPEAKLALYRALEPRMKPDAVLATNTSSLSLETLRAGLARPERLVGIHFFNPVAKMPLVEVVHADGTAADALARASAFVGQIDKLALPVKSAPGFLVNAVLAPYILQAMRSVDAGVAPAAIDAALVAFGMPMGPLELADTVGLDIARAAGESWPAARSRRAAWRTGCRGQLGRKTGQGFYAWRDGKPVRTRRPPPRRPRGRPDPAPDRRDPAAGRSGHRRRRRPGRRRRDFRNGIRPLHGRSLALSRQDQDVAQ